MSVSTRLFQHSSTGVGEPSPWRASSRSSAACVKNSSGLANSPRSRLSWTRFSSSGGRTTFMLCFSTTNYPIIRIVVGLAAGQQGIVCMRFLITLILALSAGQSAFALDREAFTITRYQLEVQIDRTTHVMAVNGKLTLRNDSNKPQKLVTLQVSSSLAWNGVALDGKLLQWLGDNYTSDIDHSGSLSEAIVTLPKDVPPATTVTLDVQYGGAVTQDATRLTRTGVPADVATRNDWDEISESFTAVRGLGYVVWYPVAIEAVSLSDGNAVFDAIARWKRRHDRSQFEASFAIDASDGQQPLRIATSIPDSDEGKLVPEVRDDKTSYRLVAKAHLPELGEIVPTFSVANYEELARPTITLLHVPDHTSLARDYALAAEASDLLLHESLPEPAGAPPFSPQARG